MDQEKLIPIKFIDEAIEVFFDSPPTFSKHPPCPSGFQWDGVYYNIKVSLYEWQDYNRRGKYKFTMRPSMIKRASKKGSWGVGRYTFIVETSSGRIFEIYYDRSPKNVDDRTGIWVLLSERERKGD